MEEWDGWIFVDRRLIIMAPRPFLYLETSKTLHNDLDYRNDVWAFQCVSLCTLNAGLKIILECFLKQCVQLTFLSILGIACT